MNVKHICMISHRYPCEADPTSHVFVQKQARAFAERGIRVSVIAPIFPADPQYRKIPWKSVEYTAHGAEVTVYRPRCITLGTRRNAIPFNSRISLRLFTDACLRTVKLSGIDPDVFLGKFVVPSGITASRLGRRFGKKAYFDCGESTAWYNECFEKEYLRRELRNIAMAFAVSTRNKEMLVRDALLPKEKIAVCVNGVDVERFRPMDRRTAREKFKIDDKEIVLSFTGQFIERKGIGELLEVLRDTDTVKAIFAGKGAIHPQGDNILFADAVRPEDMPAFLNASDLFVLPTHNEGCSNAIIEAMACGLPIISTDEAFNADILDEENAILIETGNAAQLSRAIGVLVDDADKRRRMGDASRRKAENLSVEKRAETMFDYMEHTV